MSPRAAGAVVRYAEVEGVRTVWLPQPGALRARLMFRVGMADEPLVWRGATHLIEHLALSPLTDESFAFNGQVTRTTTSFDFAGPPEVLGGFLDRVTRSLAELPFDRLDGERRILRVEGSESNFSTGDVLRCMRWGIGSYGVASGLELGLNWLGEQELEQWRRHWMTRGNAVLMLTGPPPAGLRLDLPDGPHRAAPLARPLRRPVPGPVWDTTTSSGFVLGGIVQRGIAAMAAADLLGRRLHQRLRTELALAYKAYGLCEFVENTTAELLVVADALADRVDEVRDALLDLVDGLSRNPVTPEELQGWRHRYLTALAEPTSAMALLAGAADAVLMGRRVLTAADVQHRAEQLAPTDIDKAWATMLTRADLLVPPNTRVFREGWTQHKFTAPPIGDGQRWAPARDLGAQQRLTVNARGLQYESFFNNRPKRRITVEWANVAANVRYDDGARRLFTYDGMEFLIDPGQWHRSEGLSLAIDTRVPGQRSVEAAEPRTAPVRVAAVKGLAATSTGPLVILAVAAALLTLLAFAGSATNPKGLLFALPLSAFDAWCFRSLYVRVRTPNKPRVRFRTGIGTRWTSIMVRLPTPALAGVAALAWLGPLAAVLNSSHEMGIYFGIPALSASAELVRRRLPDRASGETAGGR